MPYSSACFGPMLLFLVLAPCKGDGDDSDDLVTVIHVRHLHELWLLLWCPGLRTVWKETQRMRDLTLSIRLSLLDSTFQIDSFF